MIDYEVGQRVNWTPASHRGWGWVGGPVPAVVERVHPRSIEIRVVRFIWDREERRKRPVIERKRVRANNLKPRNFTVPVVDSI